MWRRQPMHRLDFGSTWQTAIQGDGTEVSKTRCGRLRRLRLGSSLSVTWPVSVYAKVMARSDTFPSGTT